MFDDILFEGTIIMIVGIFSFLLHILFWVSIFKFIINTFRRKKVHDFFKNNVIYNQENTVCNRMTVRGKSNKYKRIYNDVTRDKLIKFNTDNINELKKYFYEKFVQFEQAYNSLDYNTMKILSTKQLYNNYYTGITLDLRAGKKRVITDIENKKVILFELDSTTIKQVASLMVEISYFNYTLDKNGYIISGSRENKITEKFEVEFRKDFERKDVLTCPSCGAKVVGNKCDYCRNPIKNVDFKISSIKKIIEE